MSACPQFVASGPVLVVDDEVAVRSALELSFRTRGWQVQTAAGKSEALVRIRDRQPALVVSDVRMPDGDGFEVMRAVREISSKTAVILLTAFGSVPDAVAAMKAGACEYVTKPVAFEQLMETAERVVSRRPQELAQFGFEGERSPEIIGSSALLKSALEQAARAAASDADVLIEAETGTGKELLARRIHHLSRRSGRPFVAVNCAALPESLLESELFGHARGAFTGAVKASAGKFLLARGGTLLLDEIGETPLSMQPKLLRALQEREFYPLGATRPVHVDVRIIATTNRPLAEMVQAGSFRRDLFHRLHVIPLSLPPLRDRREDIRELARHFAQQSGHGDDRGLPEHFLSQLEHHPWPGNVRELANAVRRALVLGDPFFKAGTEMTINGTALHETAEICSPPFAGPLLAPGMSLADAERQLLELTLRATSGNRSRASEMLGVSLRTVRNKIREYSLPARSNYVHD